MPGAPPQSSQSFFASTAQRRLPAASPAARSAFGILKDIGQKITQPAPCSATICRASTVASGESAASGSYAGTPIKVGGIGPITGAAATYGNAVKNAEELAVKEINAANGSDV